MNNREARRFDMFNRVQTFGREHAADFAPAGEAAKQFTALGPIIEGMESARADQLGGGTTAKAVLLDALRLDLKNIARTGRALAEDDPGLADRFRAPANSSLPALTTAATAYLKELADPALVARFVAHELPADFVTDLQADLDALDNAQDDQETVRETGVSGTASIDRLVAEGMKAVTCLDAIMHNKYARVPEKLRAWQSASHIERAPQRAKPAAAPMASTPPPAA